MCRYINYYPGTFMVREMSFLFSNVPLTDKKRVILYIKSNDPMYKSCDPIYKSCDLIHKSCDLIYKSCDPIY